MAARKEGTPNTFTFYDGFASAIEALPDAKTKACFVYDFYNYGAWGIEPTFAWATDPMVKMAVEMAWHIAAPSIEKSIQNHKNSTKPPAPGKKKRGRPRKNPIPVVDDVDAFASEIPDHIIDAMAETAMMEEAEVW